MQITIYVCVNTLGLEQFDNKRYTNIPLVIIWQ